MNILAHEYAPHFISRSFIAPTDNMEYEHLTDLSTIALGMGLLTRREEGPMLRRMDSQLHWLYAPLLKYAQARYQSLKGKAPPASERPRTTIRSGKDKKWDCEVVCTPDAYTFSETTIPKLHWTERELFATFPVPTRSYSSAVEVIGRSFVNSHFKIQATSSVSQGNNFK